MVFDITRGMTLMFINSTRKNIGKTGMIMEVNLMAGFVQVKFGTTLLTKLE